MIHEELNVHPISNLFPLTILNNILHLPQLEPLLGRSLAGEFDASSLHLMQFETHSEVKGSDLNVYWIELFDVYPTTYRVISASVKISRS